MSTTQSNVLLNSDFTVGDIPPNSGNMGGWSPARWVQDNTVTITTVPALPNGILIHPSNIPNDEPSGVLFVPPEFLSYDPEELRKIIEAGEKKTAREEVILELAPKRRIVLED